MKNTYKILAWFVLAFLTGLIVSCDPNEDRSEPAGEIEILNNWIWDGMNEVYLWEEFLPNLDPDDQEDPEAYFYDLLYVDDRFSIIRDDYDELLASIDGESLSTGINAQPVLISENDVISYVTFVAYDSPAEEAGIKRGDIILSMNGQKLTRYNYFDLFYQNTITYGFATWNGTSFVSNGVEITLDGILLNENPLYYSEVIDFGDQLTGYMVYNSFTFGEEDEYFDSLDAVFTDFLEAGVKDVIVDLRYNLGGWGYVANYIAGVLAPTAVSENAEIFQKQYWNDLLTEYWKEQDLDADGKADGEESTQLLERFGLPNVNLNLPRVYFLTSGSTASASESLMIGLYPYMDVMQIGTGTVGKCYGSIPISDNYNPKRHNWVMLPLVLKYANADGFTDFVNGISPDVEVREDYRAIPPFGSMDDPLLAAALTEITGLSPAAKKALTPVPAYQILPDPGLLRVERSIPFSLEVLY